jgi:hypothetical protein
MTENNSTENSGTVAVIETRTALQSGVEYPVLPVEEAAKPWTAEEAKSWGAKMGAAQDVLQGTMGETLIEAARATYRTISSGLIGKDVPGGFVTQEDYTSRVMHVEKSWGSKLAKFGRANVLFGIRPETDEWSALNRCTQGRSGTKEARKAVNDALAKGDGGAESRATLRKALADFVKSEEVTKEVTSGRKPQSEDGSAGGQVESEAERKSREGARKIETLGDAQDGLRALVSFVLTLPDTDQVRFVGTLRKEAERIDGLILAGQRTVSGEVTKTEEDAKPAPKPRAPRKPRK